jgi:hypothetical protein
MWVEAESAAHGGMANNAIPLSVTRGAGFEALPRRLPVSEAEPPECIVISRHADPPRRNHSRLLVAALTKLRPVVTIAAIRLARVGSARVARHETGAMIA